MLKMNQIYLFHERHAQIDKNKIIKSPKPVPWRRTDEPRRLRYNRTMAMRAESNSPKAYVQRPNQRARICWSTESSQPLSVYECPAFEVLGWCFHRVFITAHDGGPMGREERCVERLSMLLMRLREG
jgi:hypothetical protein